jgi:hypothetical protein
VILLNYLVYEVYTESLVFLNVPAYKRTPYLSPMHILPLTFMCIVSHAAPGSKTPFDERYNAFFIDYSLTPLLVQHNYIDSAKNGIFKNPGLDDVTRMQMLSRASDAVSDRCVCSLWE